MFLIKIIAVALIALGVFILPTVSIDTPDMQIPNLQTQVIQQAKQRIRQAVEECESNTACSAFVQEIQNVGKNLLDLTSSQWEEVQRWKESHRIEIKVLPTETNRTNLRRIGREYRES